MSVAKLKKGLKELKNDEIFNSMYNEIKETTKELNEIYRLVVDYPFAAEVKNKLIIVDRRFRELSKMIDDLKKQHYEQQVFKARMREKILNLNKKINKMSSLLTLHQLIITNHDEEKDVLEKLKKIANKEELISQLEKFNMESLENRTDIELLETQIDYINSEIDVLVSLLEEKLKRIDNTLEKEKDEIEQLKDYVKKHENFITQILENESIIELLKKHSKELVKNKEKHTNNEENKQRKNTSINQYKKESSKSVQKKNRKRISSKENKKVRKKRKEEKRKDKEHSEKNISEYIKRLEDIVNNLPEGNLKKYYLEKIKELKEKSSPRF